MTKPAPKPIDMQKLARLDRQVNETLALLHANGAQRFMPGFYRKTLVAVASRYCALGAVQEAMKLLTLNPPEFYRDEMPAMMKNDPEFRVLATQVADAMVEADIVMTSHEHTPRYEILSEVGVA